MFFAKIPRHTRQNAITEGDLECILTRNCEGTEQLRCGITYRYYSYREQNFLLSVLKRSRHRKCRYKGVSGT